MPRRECLPSPTRRGLTRTEAASYLSVSPGTFDRLVADGRMPAPKEIDRRLVWDRFALDAAFEQLPSRGGLSHVGGDAADDGWSDYQ